MQNRPRFLSLQRKRFAWLALAMVALAGLSLAWGFGAQASSTPSQMSLGMLQANNGCIDGMVFAVVNSGDYGLGGWDVHAQLQNGTGPVYDTTTNGDGYFEFNNLPPGTYKIWIDVQPGWVLYSGISNPREHVTVDDTTCTDANRVIFKVEQGGTPTPGTPEPATRIDGFVYEETCDGVIPFEGARLEVWSSSLPDSLDALVQDRYSDMSGYFNFHILPAYLADYLHLLLIVPSNMEVINTISPEGVVVSPEHIRFDFPGFELLSGNQFILRQKDLVCETPTPTPTPTITPTPTPFKLYLPIILTRPPMCEVAYLYVNVWGKEYHIPLQDVPYVYTLRPLPWQYPTTFYLKEYEGDSLWTQYDPTYHKQIGGYEFTYPGGHPGEEFTLYLRTDCGEIAIMSNIDDPTPTPPPTAAPPPSGWVPLLQQDFDGGSMGDTERAGSPTWGLASCEADSPPYSIWPAARGRAAAQPCVENYANDMESWIIFGPFNLTDATQAELTFDYLLDTEKGADWFGWYASADNVHYSGIRESGDSHGWTSQTFSLANWLGQEQVWVAFIFESDGQNADKGVFLDNVSVRKYVDAGLPRSGSLRVTAPDRERALQPATRVRR